MHVLIYPVECHSWAKLLGDARGPCKVVSDNTNPVVNWFLGEPKDVMLHLDLSESKQKKGGFKLAVLGSCTVLLVGTTNDVCTKQTYYVKEKVINEKGTFVERSFNIPHDGRRQFQNLTMEIACLVWARVLLEIIYQIKILGQPQFPIPRFHFVEAALAIEQLSDEHGKETGRVFLLEEVIQKNEEGKFRKYLNNISPVPLPMDNNEDAERAQFLAFSQHIQYFKTKKLVFVLDYQGNI